jgi:hypothetical protein
MDERPYSLIFFSTLDINNNRMKPLSLHHVYTQKITKSYNCLVIITHSTIQEVIVCLLVVLVQPMHIHKAHIGHGAYVENTTFLCWPFILEGKYILALLVVLINDGQILVQEMENLWTGEELVINIAKVILKVASIKHA